MDSIGSLKERYQNLDKELSTLGEESIDSDCLIAFEYEYPDEASEVSIETDEFTALCPWTGLPDYGLLTVTYTPAGLCVELKSLKYYLLSYRDVGIVQEHAANRILYWETCTNCRGNWLLYKINLPCSSIAYRVLHCFFLNFRNLRRYSYDHSWSWKQKKRPLVHLANKIFQHLSSYFKI